MIRENSGWFFSVIWDIEVEGVEVNNPINWERNGVDVCTNIFVEFWLESTLRLIYIESSLMKKELELKMDKTNAK